MLIYLEHINERIKYTFDFVFSNRSIEYVLTDNEGTFNASSGFKVNYSAKHLQADVHIVPAKLLLGTENRILKTEKRKFYQEECLSFDELVDPFASIFYVLTRMEEYHSNDFDQHDRFKSKNSVLFKNNWLELAICDRWAEDILAFLSSKGFSYQKPEKYEVKIRPSFDIDNTFAYAEKVGLRKILASAKDLAKGNKHRTEERKLVLSGKQNDPYDTFSTINEIIQRGFEVNVFWLLGDFAKFDRNLPHTNEVQKTIIQLLSRDAEIGIHPSYQSKSKKEIVAKEIKRLTEILRNKVNCSRQHFLRLQFPQTYHALLANEIEHDFTMGYAEQVGFRAGTARPFFWYDLTQEKTTKLMIHPFAYMDGTLNEYCHYSITEAKEKITKLFDEVEHFGGDFSFIWHNETIGNYGIWKGWSEVLEHSLNLSHE